MCAHQIFQRLSASEGHGRILVSALCPKTHGRLAISEDRGRISACPGWVRQGRYGRSGRNYRCAVTVVIDRPTTASVHCLVIPGNRASCTWRRKPRIGERVQIPAGMLDRREWVRARKRNRAEIFRSPKCLLGFSPQPVATSSPAACLGRAGRTIM